MNKSFIAIATSCLLTISTTAAADITSSVNLASDYTFNGVSQTGNDPALQASLDYAGNSGFYAGTWASNVDFGSGEDIFLQEDPGIAPGYIYTAGPPDDGFYTISNNLGNWSELFDCWLQVQDNNLGVHSRNLIWSGLFLWQRISILYGLVIQVPSLQLV